MTSQTMIIWTCSNFLTNCPCYWYCLMRIGAQIRFGSFSPHLSREWCEVCHPRPHKDKGEWPSLGGTLSREPELCPVQRLRAYERRTQALQPASQQMRTPLFISVRKPHQPVKPATLGKWLKGVMHHAGINTEAFSAHSTRGAPTSKALVTESGS